MYISIPRESYTVFKCASRVSSLASLAKFRGLKYFTFHLSSSLLPNKLLFAISVAKSFLLLPLLLLLLRPPAHFLVKLFSL